MTKKYIPAALLGVAVIASAGFCLARQAIAMLPVTPTPDAVNSPSISLADQAWATRAAQVNNAEIRLGELAVHNGSSDAVKAYGQMMIDTHTQANVDLMVVLCGKRMSLDTSETPGWTTMYDQLSGLSGDAFDHAYMSAQTIGHLHAENLYQVGTHTIADADVRTYAIATLPTVEKHLMMAEAVTGVPASVKTATAPVKPMVVHHKYAHHRHRYHHRRHRHVMFTK